MVLKGFAKSLGYVPDDELKAAINNMMEERTKSEEQIAGKEKEISLLRGQVEMLERENKDNQERLGTLSADIEKISSQYGQTLEDFKISEENSRKTLELFEKQTGEFRKKCAELEVQRGEAQKQCKDLEKRCSELEKKKKKFEIHVRKAQLKLRAHIKTSKHLKRKLKQAEKKSRDKKPLPGAKKKKR